MIHCSNGVPVDTRLARDRLSLYLEYIPGGKKNPLRLHGSLSLSKPVGYQVLAANAHMAKRPLAPDAHGCEPASVHIFRFHCPWLGSGIVKLCYNSLIFD
jgi:hypothetical protein